MSTAPIESLSLHPLRGVPAVRPGDDLPALLADAAERCGLHPRPGDVIVVCQKVVSKAEGRVVDLRTVEPSPLARRIAEASAERDARAVEVILRESRRIVRMRGGHLIVETGPGWVCANAGVDASNADSEHEVLLLPEHPDRSARAIRDCFESRYGPGFAVIVSDTWGRPWREGLVDFAIGLSGMDAMLDLRGTRDLAGRELRHTVLAVADALAAAAGLLMLKDSAVPAVLVRGFPFSPSEGSATQLIRLPERDLFR